MDIYFQVVLFILYFSFLHFSTTATIKWCRFLQFTFHFISLCIFQIVLFNFLSVFFFKLPSFQTICSLENFVAGIFFFCSLASQTSNFNVYISRRKHSIWIVHRSFFFFMANKYESCCVFFPVCNEIHKNLRQKHIYFAELIYALISARS